ncbi:NAD-dependent epimerase/dehydratase family protein [Actinokineospora sp. NBRC 105648]|uniref:NAD-dependent epimerase/dehydratase family protein n=1 Tax=Actinokineospora sp. NBRC 105648 TaxID=3032206 RepID=UPI0024A46AA1|nr:NAD-dependent epimerase/dehydratase family protein [Actinokineospora sp. NBRC 105648]GLZ36485.1 UDP-glucose 4-epimerase [Actinokineospora sp. NBRC 105648]
MTRVVVLGASGFIGSGITRALARADVSLRVVARRPTPAPAHVEVRAADLTDGVAEHVADADAVVHLAAYTDGGWRVADGDTVAERVNVGLVADLVDALRGRPSPPVVLFAGTETQVGLTERVRIDGSEPDNPRSAYTRQKLAAENLLKDATAEGVLRGVSLRLPTVYGQGPETTARDKGVVALMVRKAFADEPLTMWHDGTVRRDFVYIDDVTAAFVSALDNADALAGKHYVLGSGVGEPLGKVFAEIAARVSATTGRPPVPVVSVPPPGHAEPTDLKSVEVDASAFRAVTGWEPRVPLTEGIRRTVASIAGE